MNKSVVWVALANISLSFSLWAAQPTPIALLSAADATVDVNTAANRSSQPAALSAGDSQIDVEAVMKTMALHYKQAAKSQSIADMTTEVTLFQQALVKAKGASYPADKAAKFQQGFQEIEQSISATQAALQQNDLAKAKQHWQLIDAARKTYHKMRSPSIWDLLFGGA
jgi:soluble cytochrome b562